MHCLGFKPQTVYNDKWQDRSPKVKPKYLNRSLVAGWWSLSESSFYHAGVCSSINFYDKICFNSLFDPIKTGCNVIDSCLCCDWVGWVYGRDFHTIYCADSDSKWHQKVKMAAPMSGIFWLHFCTVEGSDDMSAIFNPEYGLHLEIHILTQN